MWNLFAKGVNCVTIKRPFAKQWALSSPEADSPAAFTKPKIHLGVTPFLSLTPAHLPSTDFSAMLCCLMCCVSPPCPILSQRYVSYCYRELQLLLGPLNFSVPVAWVCFSSPIWGFPALSFANLFFSYFNSTAFTWCFRDLTACHILHFSSTFGILILE